LSGQVLLQASRTSAYRRGRAANPLQELHGQKLGFACHDPAPTHVIPPKAGIHLSAISAAKRWIPAFGEMTR
jgi:hypothetical protein